MGSLAQNGSGAIRCSCNPRFRRRFRRVPESSRGFRCRKLMRFQRVPVQKADEVPDGSSADGWWGSGWFRMVPVQIANKVPAGSGADGWWGSGYGSGDGWWGSGVFRYTWQTKFRRVPVQMVLAQMADEVPAGSGADGWRGSRRFRCR